MSQPTQTCMACGRVEIVRPDGRGFPPDITKRRLVKRCKEAGCVCEPRYRAGIAFEPMHDGPSFGDYWPTEPSPQPARIKEDGCDCGSPLECRGRAMSGCYFGPVQ